MSYTVLARRYRSQAFAEVVGQEGIVQTLQNAITADRVAHAYLFCGTRGVGKTSTARVFAKALNAVDDKGKENKEVADAIMAGRDTDVIEIDAASNNSVDNVRDLIANAVYRPMRGRRKIYIIDEVHMLSTGAFNALLKIMEEPPSHVVFILCTTETHKVPATIQSRCQRFDFRNITTRKIAAHLAEVVKAEGVKADDELLHMVARLGNGSMRDALSLLDRLLASGAKHITPEILESLLGLADRTLIAELVEAFADGEPALALERSDQLLQRGISLDQALSAIAERLRDLMVMVACGKGTTLVELSDEARAAAATQAARFDVAGISHMIALCEGVGRSVRSSAFPRAIFDALMVRLAQAEKIADITALIAAGAGVAASAPPAPPARTPAPAPQPAGVPAPKKR
ncbi:MAG: DNA polymerase III subunit gamma/tau [Phycisphaerales bacterium]